MLVAERRFYERYEEYRPVHKSNKRTGVKKKSKKKSMPKPLRTFLCIGIFFVIGFVIVLRQVTLTELSNMVDKQRKYLSALEKTNSQLRAETIVSLKTVDEVATNNLGMGKPYQYQVVYVDLSQADSSNKQKDNKHESEFKIAKKLGEIIEYLY